MSDENEEEDVGFHFHPTDEELIKEYLIPKRDGQTFEDIIATKDVYSKEPWSLVDHTNDPFFVDGVWYYFTPRDQISEKNIGCGKNSNRKITGDNDGIDRGFWRQNNKRNIIEENTGLIIGTKENLTYHASKNKKQKRGDGGASATVPGSEISWIMNQYTLPYTGTFQELVLCEIHTKNPKKKEDLHESSTSTEQQPININSESVVAASSEHQQHIAYPCSAAETQRNREQSGETNMVPQRDDWSSAWRKHYYKGVTLNGSSLPIEEGGNTPWTGQKMLHDHEASTSSHPHVSSSWEQQHKPINLRYKTREKKKSIKKKKDAHHKAHILHHHESSYSEIFENHLHYPEIPRIQSMSNSAAETERNKKHNGEEKKIHQIDDFSSIKLDDAYDKDEDWDEIVAMLRDEADAPDWAWMDHDH